MGWRPVAEPGTDLSASRSVPAGETTDVGPLACHLRHGHWLAVLGPGGAGKTTLALLLMESLLADRNTADPVPVLLPAASLAPGEMVRSWIARTLADRYPSLRDAQAYGPDAPGDLVARRKVLPVIDGLDDLEPLPRAALLGALQRALGRDQPLVVTCRPEEYHQAVAEIGRAPQDMAVIELQPVTAADAAMFLERGAAGPDGPSLAPDRRRDQVPAGRPAGAGPVEPPDGERYPLRLRGPGGSSGRACRPRRRGGDRKPDPRRPGIHALPRARHQRDPAPAPAG